jgi:XisI protein
METLDKYRQIVRDLLTAHATINEPDIESQVICDTESDRYLLLDIGLINVLIPTMVLLEGFL